MVEAVRTTASPAAIWVIVIVAMVVLAAWLAAIVLADRYQVRTSGRNRVPGAAGPAVSDARTAEGVPDEQAAAAPGAPVRETVGPAGRPARDGSVPEWDIPTRVDLPAQRSGDADRAERSHAGRPADGDESPR